MDFRQLSYAIRSQPPQGANGTNMTLTELPPSLLDSLIPGYSLISNYILAAFGLDISLFVSIGVILLALTTGGQYFAKQIEQTFRRLFVSSVHVNDSDDLFDMIMSWLEAHQTTSSQRSVKAKTQRGTQWEDTLDNTGAAAALDANGKFNYNKWAARVPPRYEPYYGTMNYFWHGGRLFLFKRSHSPYSQSVTVSWNSQSDDDVLQLDCIGRSIQPIRELLREIKVWSLDRQRNTTTIRHPTPKDRARYGGAWSKTSSRPSRPMETVILDAAQKAMIQKDMNEYLHPASPRWYAARGIPYRRGYLFHGPPGTGKTSLSFALAGIFGLEIFAISLQEPNLTEGDLMQLFNGLPRRCIVLMEDIDAAGLIRDGKSDDEQEGKQKGEPDEEEKESQVDDGQKDGKKTKEEAKKDDDDASMTLKEAIQDLAKALRSTPSTNPSPSTKTPASTNRPNARAAAAAANKPPTQPPNTGISLSGLLNAIDGVATHEGRVLIMTTNHPEKLDSALIRPGRIDRRVQFRLALPAQVSELFLRMYATPSSASAPTDAKTAFSVHGGVVVDGDGDGDEDEDELPSLRPGELGSLAEVFAAEVPGAAFTPAEIQNFLMRFKKQPRRAVRRVGEWVGEMKGEKGGRWGGKKREGEGRAEGLGSPA
ncbi:hypothetical protein MBLNU230_g0582t1 [Neophaeotheca triangularis]